MAKAGGKGQPSASSELDLKAKIAMMDLQTLLVGNHSLHTLSAEFHKAKDQVERLKQEPAKGKDRENLARPDRSPRTNKNINSTKNRETSRSVNGKSTAKEAPNRPEFDLSLSSGQPKKIPASKEPRADSQWNFWIENLIHISCYQIALRPKPAQKEQIASFSQVAQQLDISITPSKVEQSSVVILRRRGIQQESDNKEIFRVRLPGKIQPQPSSFQVNDNPVGDGSLNLRLQYEGSFDQQDLDLSSGLVGLNEANANQLCCKYCHIGLVREGAELDRVVQMPSANWDDIADYLICYSGQATIDFTTAYTNNAQVGSVLLDTNALLLHQDDVGTSVCVLAVDGYGQPNSVVTGSTTHQEQENPTQSPFAAAAEELGADAPAVVRGARDWRETVGGGSICCSQCCSVLGFASVTSPETYRFLKHRLVTTLPDPALEDTSSSDQLVPVMPCSAFVAQEMIRYAETKAIFTFAVERISSSAHPSSKQHLLLLKLLSWDAHFATNSDLKYKDLDQASVPWVHFRKAAKIIFEELWLDSDVGKGMNSGNDPSNWVWGGVDLCCLPGSKTQANTASTVDGDQSSSLTMENTNNSSSSVRLLLAEDEWDDLQESLRKDTGFFSKDIVEATVAAKLGRRTIPSSQGNKQALGLSLIHL